MGTISEKLTYLNGTKQKLKQAINNIGGEVTDETTFREYVNQLENVYDILPKTEYQEGTEVNLGKTIKGKLDYDNGVVGIGQASQDSTKGYQLFDIGLVPTANKQYVRNNGFILTKGINRTIQIGLHNPLPAGTYTLSAVVKNSTLSNNSKINCSFKDGNNVDVVGNVSFLTNGTVTITSEVTQLYFFIVSSETDGVTITLDDIMLESGSTTHNWEQYTGGQASPNPSYPQTINSVTGNQDVVVSGKNLVDVSKNVDGYAINSSGQITSSGGFNYTELIPVSQGTYIYSGKRTSSESTNRRVHAYNSSGTWIKQINAYTPAQGDFYYTINIDDDNIKYLRLSYTNTDTNVMVEQGSTATTYEPYITPTSYQLSLGDIQLCGIGDYKDELVTDRSTGKWYKHNEIGKVVLNGSENWAYYQAGLVFYTNDYNDLFNIGANNVSLYSNYFKGGYYSNTNNVMQINQLGRIHLRYDDITNVADLKSWLSTHNTILYARRGTPTDTEITDTTLISQLENWYNGHSNNGTTIITSNGNLPMIIKVRALKGE